MTINLQHILGEALDDEYKARATYEEIIRVFGPVRPFSRIVAAVDRHVRALLGLYKKYRLPIPPDPWRGRVNAPASLLQASQEAVRGEIDNAAMYHRLLAASQDYPEVRAVLGNLQRASRDNHLPAFQRALRRYGGTPTGMGFTVERAPERLSPSPVDRVTAPLAVERCGDTSHWHHTRAARGGGCGGRGWGGGRCRG